MVDSDGDSMDATLNTIAARLSKFQSGVERQFAQLGEQSDQVNEQFVLVDQRFEQVDQRLKQVDQRLEQVDQRFDRMEALIRSEGERTRRHFDVVAEHMKAERNLVLDLGVASAAKVARFYAANASERELVEKTLVDHEVRLRQLEGKDELG